MKALTLLKNFTQKFFWILFGLLALTLGGFRAEATQPAVVSANPLASKVGLEVLQMGGSAADAAIATAFALTVVEPQNSGIGGGGFLLYYEAKSQRFYFLDYREIAPSQASRDFYQGNREKLSEGIYSVAIPGFVRGMEVIHKKWRRVSWPRLIEPAIDLARKGIPIHGIIREQMEKRREILERDPEFQRIFLEPMDSGYRVEMKDLAITLEDIKTGGSETFYDGPLSKKIVATFKNHEEWITAQDLENYEAFFRRPHQFSFEDYEITSAPLPSSGGTGMDLLFRKAAINHLEKETPFSPRAYEVLLSVLKEYMDYREAALGDNDINRISQTTHLSVIDAEGNMASMTNTLNSHFGAGIIIPGTGIILNNEMGDFSLKSNTANRIRGGRRPLSSMSPTIIFKDENPYMVIGTPGGVTIPQNIFQILFFDWAWKVPHTRALAQPKIYSTGEENEVVVEAGLKKKIKKALENSHSLEIRPSVGNVQSLILRSEKKTLLSIDPRGEGGGFTSSQIQP